MIEVLPVSGTFGNVETVAAAVLGLVLVCRRRKWPFQLISLLDLVEKVVKVAVDFVFERVVLVVFSFLKRGEQFSCQVTLGLT